MLGARRSCGRGDWRRVGRRSWRIRRAVRGVGFVSNGVLVHASGMV